MDQPKTIVTVGGGFAGTTLARALDGKLQPGYELVLISEESYTTFNPMLPEALGASIFPEQAVAPIRQMLAQARFVMGRVTAVDTATRTLTASTLAGETEVLPICASRGARMSRRRAGARLGQATYAMRARPSSRSPDVASRIRARTTTMRTQAGSASSATASWVGGGASAGSETATRESRRKQSTASPTIFKAMSPPIHRCDPPPVIQRRHGCRDAPALQPCCRSTARGENVMSTSNTRRAPAARSVLFATLLSAVGAAPAFAGECPADKAGANPLAGAATAPVGVTEMELSSIDLGKESVKLPQRRLRYRHMEITPGGVVPLHSHADRPALIMVNQGQIYEYSSQCKVPILHKAGEIGRESSGLMHWWKNEGSQTVVLTIADIVNDRKPDTMMPMM